LKKQDYDTPFLVDEKGNAMKISTEITKNLHKIFNKKNSSHKNFLIKEHLGQTSVEPGRAK
jgi:hypothetical protein